MDKKDYYLYVKGKAVKVSEEVYKAYWKITEHEKYLQRKDCKYDVIPFSAMDYDCRQYHRWKNRLRKNCRNQNVNWRIKQFISYTHKRRKRANGSHFLQRRKS